LQSIKFGDADLLVAAHIQIESQDEAAAWLQNSLNFPDQSFNARNMLDHTYTID
jgi:hypothetical protein